ncbi:hypothetical protein HHI36_016584 [Cryptolaemus montrouzieri]|uniref:Protein Wnt n=1 Tax=Cryptolaemus montrouzieri TaxID=559131 RepID=A0ABD2NKI8_9CUCU
MAMIFCNKEFKWKRWNCPTSDFSRKTNHLLTKEIAYTRAIISAAIVHSISRNCSQSKHKSCNCNSLHPSSTLEKEMQRMEKIPLPKIDNNPTGVIGNSYNNVQKQFNKFEEAKYGKDIVWSWGGCSDDPGHGEHEARKLFADYERGSDAQAFIEKHNNRVGRQVVKESLVRKCRCHGVSGSCSHQTCWLEVAPFGQIARTLKDRYKNAVRISFEQIRGARTIGNTARFQLNQKLSHISPKQLVYLDESPDYCVPNSSTGWPGTIGRACSRPGRNSSDHEEKRSCRNLCRSCGHRVRRQKKKIAIRCNCAFQWCCELSMINHLKGILPVTRSQHLNIALSLTRIYRPVAFCISTIVLGVNYANLKSNQGNVRSPEDESDSPVEIENPFIIHNPTDMSKYRLPLLILPKTYDLYLYPDLQTGNFSGKIIASVNVSETTDVVTVNSKGLSIKNAKIDNEEASIDYDEKFERLNLRKKSGNNVDSPNSVIEMEFDGDMKNKITGLYTSSYKNKNGELR